MCLAWRKKVLRGIRPANRGPRQDPCRGVGAHRCSLITLQDKRFTSADARRPARLGQDNQDSRVLSRGACIRNDLRQWELVEGDNLVQRTGGGGVGRGSRGQFGGYQWRLSAAPGRAVNGKRRITLCAPGKRVWALWGRVSSERTWSGCVVGCGVWESVSGGSGRSGGDLGVTKACQCHESGRAGDGSSSGSIVPKWVAVSAQYLMYCTHVVHSGRAQRDSNALSGSQSGGRQGCSAHAAALALQVALALALQAGP